MLTILSCFVPNIKDIKYSIYVEYCAERAKYYCKKKDVEKILYWSNLACEYLLKRLDLRSKKRV